MAGVQVMQALVARELVERFGLPERRAAALLGIVPSSISQYLSGKRLGPALAAYWNDEGARRLARRAAQQLVQGAGGPRSVLEAALALGERPPSSPSAPVASGPPATPSRETPLWLRHRIEGEQQAVAECMRLAQRSRDELTRAIFRQIASDSLRHAEIVASLGELLDRGISSSRPSGITPTDVEALIARERAAEEAGDAGRRDGLGGVMGILWESMEADERKHELLLARLLDAAREPPASAPPAGASRRPAARRRPAAPDRSPSQGPLPPR
ncbi:MAG TPA: hypothetical protein VML53_06685 [Thermoplasmata archaeon]|nr:hypothetical protein [Thermoplasmata archaeon]